MLGPHASDGRARAPPAAPAPSADPSGSVKRSSHLCRALVARRLQARTDSAMGPPLGPPVMSASRAFTSASAWMLPGLSSHRNSSTDWSRSRRRQNFQEPSSCSSSPMADAMARASGGGKGFWFRNASTSFPERSSNPRLALPSDVPPSSRITPSSCQRRTRALARHAEARSEALTAMSASDSRPKDPHPEIVFTADSSLAWSSAAAPPALPDMPLTALPPARRTMLAAVSRSAAPEPASVERPSSLAAASRAATNRSADRRADRGCGSRASDMPSTDKMAVIHP
mmetsp:Transcript_20691/g.79399  ORF Transcript_20691/g.79399 Transcript_20691/m.79399 type:complete len:285 (-) Transcript_20691:153-1007(-)